MSREEVDSHVCTRTSNNDGTKIIICSYKSNLIVYQNIYTEDLLNNTIDSIDSKSIIPNHQSGIARPGHEVAQVTTPDYIK